VSERSLRHDGIFLYGNRYSGEEVGPILRAYGEGVKVRLVYDPENLGEIQVWGPDDVDPVTVKAVDYEFVNGLTVKQNKFIREYLRAQGETVVDRAALERARLELAQAIEELMTSRKHNARRRSAALRGITSNRTSGTEIPESKAKKPGPSKKNKPIKTIQPSDVGQDEQSLELIKPFQMKRDEDE
jgi:putative transposase